MLLNVSTSTISLMSLKKLKNIEIWLLAVGQPKIGNDGGGSQWYWKVKDYAWGVREESNKYKCYIYNRKLI